MGGSLETSKTVENVHTSSMKFENSQNGLGTQTGHPKMAYSRAHWRSGVQNDGFL